MYIIYKQESVDIRYPLQDKPKQIDEHTGWQCNIGTYLNTQTPCPINTDCGMYNNINF